MPESLIAAAAALAPEAITAESVASGFAGVGEVAGLTGAATGAAAGGGVLNSLINSPIAGAVAGQAAGALIGNMLGSKGGASANPGGVAAPQLAPVTTMPTPTDTTSQDAKRRSIAAQMQRQGRASTILTGADSDVMG